MAVRFEIMIRKKQFTVGKVSASKSLCGLPPNLTPSE